MIADHVINRNSKRYAQWRWRWHQQGGGAGWTARPLADLRNADDLRRGRIVEFKVKRLRKKTNGKVINLQAERAKRGPKTSRAMGARA